MDDLDVLIALRGSLQSSLIHVQALIEKLTSAPKTPPLKVSDQASEDPNECLHPYLVSDLPAPYYMCQTCGAQKVDGGEWTT